jgi:ABC-type transport system involved in cytochrome c biogenesis permease subunit
VVCITLGYATTFVSGFLGILYIMRGNRLGLLALALILGGASAYFLMFSIWDYATLAAIAFGLATLVCTPFGFLLMVSVLRPDLAILRHLPRMTYGALCFSILFSFFGTVLGGLWADDSWGRFWGWDPKENGALMIVLWNALVLHARWDGLVKDRGLAVLAVLGNIAVSWSWFGVNELGVGLHSYGFTEGVLLTLGLFCMSQLLIAAVGCLPRELWFSRPEEKASPA